VSPAVATEDRAWQALATRLSPVEVIVIEALARTEEPLAAVLIDEMLDDPAFDLQTLTRTMRRLREAGAIEFVELRPGRRGEMMRLYGLPQAQRREVSVASSNPSRPRGWPTPSPRIAS
jgi:DNA-binding MarR family transcriptional regulator